MVGVCARNIIEESEMLKKELLHTAYSAFVLILLSLRYSIGDNNEVDASCNLSIKTDISTYNIKNIHVNHLLPQI